MRKLSIFMVMSLVSFMAAANTEFVAGKELVSIKGASVAAAEMTVFAVMVPKYTLSKGSHDPKAVENCTFAEDATGANGNQVIQHVSLKREKDSSYSVEVPEAGNRGVCDYVLDAVYLSITDKALYELFKIRSQANVEHSNFVLGAYGPDNVLKLDPKGTTINCEFSKAKEDTAGCFHGKDLLVDDLEIKDGADSFVLDFKDKTKNIFDTLSIQTK